LDDEPQVQGAGFSWLLTARRLPFQDVLLLMMAVSDNLCANLIIRHIGIERLARVFKEQLGLSGCLLQRKLMDYQARARGLDNYVTPADCIRFFELVHSLTQDERAWVEPVLAANQDDLLLMRQVPRDTLTFYHKTGSMTAVLHDWGYTRQCDIFLLTQGVRDEPAVFEVFGALGRLLS
jgi:beta-lactamase class A